MPHALFKWKFRIDLQTYINYINKSLKEIRKTICVISTAFGEFQSLYLGLILVHLNHTKLLCF